MKYHKYFRMLKKQGQGTFGNASIFMHLSLWVVLHWRKFIFTIITHIIFIWLLKSLKRTNRCLSSCICLSGGAVIWQGWRRPAGRTATPSQPFKDDVSTINKGLEILWNIKRIQLETHAFLNRYQENVENGGFSERALSINWRLS